MSLAQDHITPKTPMGGNLLEDGATFRVWAPGAQAVHVKVNADSATWQPSSGNLLVKDQSGIWTGFVPGLKDGDRYRYYVIGPGGKGFKRDPHARELDRAGYPFDCDCILRDPSGYPWHDAGFKPPAFNDLIIYQLHIGTFSRVDRQGKDRRLHQVGTILDVLDRLPHLVNLGINAIQPLPVVEFPSEHSMGYNGTDYFSPEEEYTVRPTDPDFPAYLAKVNQLLAGKQQPPLTSRQLESQIDQLKALIDICHLYGIAVLLDVVYNHAGGDFRDQSLYFFDRAANGNNNNSLYFTDQGWAGGLVFAFWRQEVRQFLIDNASFFCQEYHIDGIRYDEVTVIDNFGGWGFCQDLTSTVRFQKPRAVQIAEYWKSDPSWVIRDRPAGGAGFDAVWYDGLRRSIRSVIGQAAQGKDAFVDLDVIRSALYRPEGFAASWRAVQHLENHDLVYADHGDRQPRVAALGDSSNARSWYARSRARVANGLLLTAPGIPMLFMGQEFLEDKFWSDNPEQYRDTLIWWDGLDPGNPDRSMGDHLRFMSELAWLRRRQPALRAEPIDVYHVHNNNRVLAFHRWLDGIGRDVVIVASLNETTLWQYQLGFPAAGDWLEVFNSDVYDHWVNPSVAGNGGRIAAAAGPLHGLPTSATIVIPANSILVFARDQGD